tara:strand:- start:3551 stop:4033 length:483 start_codon:yes stop_codon:yes gene_type:complete
MMSKIPVRVLVALFGAVLLLGAVGPAAVADEKFGFGREIEGTYILSQEGTTTHSSYMFTEFGAVIWSASDQREFAYAPGNGVWKQTGDRSAKVRIVSFELDGSGVAVIDMEFNFSDDFSTVSGSFEGGIYPPDVNVNAIDREPRQNLANRFTGVRLTLGE